MDYCLLSLFYKSREKYLPAMNQPATAGVAKVTPHVSRRTLMDGYSFLGFGRLASHIRGRGAV